MNSKAVYIPSRGQAELCNVADPPPLGTHDIRGHTVCSLISPGTELGWAFDGPNTPCWPGYAAVFRVEETGPAVTEAPKGQLRFCMGPHRSWQQVTVQESLAVSDNLPPWIAVLTRLLGVSMTTLITATARPGDVVVVMGGGPVGYLGALLFAACGYNVHLVEPEGARRERLRTLCDLPVYPAPPVHDPQIAGHAALVLECSGHEQAVLDACRLIRPRGEVVLVGVPWRQHIDTPVHALLDLVFHQYAVVRSGWEWEVPAFPGHFQPHAVWTGLRTALEWLETGRIQPGDCVTRVSPSDAQTVYTSLLHKQNNGLFTVFDWTLC